MIPDQSVSEAATKLINESILGAVLIITVAVSAIVIWWIAKQWLKALAEKDAEKDAHRLTSEKVILLTAEYRNDTQKWAEFVKTQFELFKEFLKQKERP